MLVRIAVPSDNSLWFVTSAHTEPYNLRRPRCILHSAPPHRVPRELTASARKESQGIPFPWPPGGQALGPSAGNSAPSPFCRVLTAQRLCLATDSLHSPSFRAVTVGCRAEDFPLLGQSIQAQWTLQSTSCRGRRGGGRLFATGRVGCCHLEPAPVTASCMPLKPAERTLHFSLGVQKAPGGGRGG